MRHGVPNLINPTTGQTILSSMVRRMLLALPLLALSQIAASQVAASQPTGEVLVTTRRVSIEHVRMTSPRSFSEVKSALESRLRRYDAHMADLLRQGDPEPARAELERLAAPTGLTLLQSLDPGVALVLRGKRRNAVQYGIGNVLTATEMTQYQLGAGLYAPIRVLLYEGDDGKAVIEYDRPSSSFAIFDDPRVDAVARRLDGQLDAVLRQATQPAAGK
jgi:hypothetical protein